jgi:hypothetical protein
MTAAFRVILSAGRNAALHRPDAAWRQVPGISGKA